MNKNNLFAILFSMFSFSCIFSQETLEFMFYNILNYPDQGPASRIDHLEDIITSAQPDVFMICELNTVQGSNLLLNMLQNVKPNYMGANFVNNTSDDDIGNQNHLQNMLYYDASKFILEDQTEVTTTIRDFNHYTLKLNTIDQATNPIILNIIVCHLKSSSGTDNQLLRLGMVETLETYLDTLPNDELVLLGGDLNVYTHSELAFQELINTSNNITFVDPSNRIGSWHNNTTYIDVFTQSTRTQTGLGGATGGFDDRFDFILMSENLLTSSDLYYVPNSYKVFGNNSTINCYNQEINSSNCSGLDYDQAIRDDLYFMSDHLPVIAQLETNEVLLSAEEFAAIHPIQVMGSNVVSDWLNLQLSSVEPNIDYISIYNTLGQKIENYKIENYSQLKLDVSNFSVGVYYIIASNRTSKPIKFIKR